MRIINFEQGSSEWLNWRKTVITATDCASIMGSAFSKTEYKCWQLKLGIIEDDPVNEAMERGMRLEPVARDKFIQDTGIEMIPVVVESSDYEFLGASLDGISSDHKFILEIKCGGKKLHEMAESGEMPLYYRHQIQHQLLVTGADRAYYYSFDGENGIILEVFADMEFQDEYIKKARAFWRKVAYREAPQMEKKDYREMAENYYYNICEKNYISLDNKIKELEKEKEELKKNLIQYSGGENTCGEFIKVTKMIRPGNICYEDIPQLKEVNLEQYRKSPTICWRITI